ncbi:hypothetical protein CEXT_196531 [Caerostris extrusa]|uniref:Uncharacterized protein n=1 Tax=Caerostris extrusa TaxID=172846 RepID=A0AAV4RU20_CAEEX|nr:hypothetical protein CEXT_196531 [Caerostris extrusa]
MPYLLPSFSINLGKKKVCGRRYEKKSLLSIIMAIKRGLQTELHLLHYSELGDPYFTPFISRPLANGLATVEKHFVYRARIPFFSASGLSFL